MIDKKSRLLFAKLISKNDKFIVSGHQGPDGDVIGSTLAMTLGLRGLGKKVLAFNHDGCPGTLKFLYKSDSFKNEIPKAFANAILITVDSGDMARLGSKIAAGKFSEIWNVDHHHSNTKFGKYNFIDVKAGSTGQVVHDLLSGIKGFKLTKPIAQSIFCTLSTDTGSFKYSNATPEVFNLAAKLVEAGAEPDVISQALYETYPQRRLLLLQKVLQTLKFELGGKFAVMISTLKDLKDSGALSEDSDEFVNMPRGVVGVKIVCFLKEKSSTEWKVSFRSRDGIKVLKLAQKFGGGGHELAAGATIQGNLKDILANLTGEVQKII